MTSTQTSSRLFLLPLFLLLATATLTPAALIPESSANFNIVLRPTCRSRACIDTVRAKLTDLRCVIHDVLPDVAGLDVNCPITVGKDRLASTFDSFCTVEQDVEIHPEGGIIPANPGHIKDRRNKHSRVSTASTTRELADDFWGLDRIDQTTLPLNGAYNWESIYPSAGSGVEVYIIDTGCRTSHTQFASINVSTLAVNNSGISSGDDLIGFGTHYAGIVAGIDAGVAKNATLVCIRIFDDAGRGSIATAISAINYVVNQKIARPNVPMVMSINIGLPKQYSSYIALDVAIESAAAKNIVAIIAGGNNTDDACLYSPSRVSTAIKVVATDASDVVAPFSNYGSCIDIVAPGVDVLSAFNQNDTVFALRSSTSVAAAHAAGVAALVLAECPHFSFADLKGYMVNNLYTAGDKPMLNMQHPCSTPSPAPTQSPSPVPVPPTPSPPPTTFGDPSEDTPTTPSESPSPMPTDSPAPAPTPSPLPVPTESPSPVPTASPSPVPTKSPSPVPTSSPSPVPSPSPSPVPTPSPSPFLCESSLFWTHSIINVGDHQMDTDVDGKIAIAGSARIDSSKIGKKVKVPKDTAAPVLILGGDAVVTSSAVENGNLIFSSQLQISNTRVDGRVLKANIVDFVREKATLRGLVSFYAAMSGSGSISVQSNRITLIGDNERLNVFHIDASDLCTGASGDCVSKVDFKVPKTSRVIVNVAGQHVRLAKTVVGTGNTDGRLILNFFEADAVEMSHANVKASVLTAGHLTIADSTVSGHIGCDGFYGDKSKVQVHTFLGHSLCNSDGQYDEHAGDKDEEFVDFHYPEESDDN